MCRKSAAHAYAMFSIFMLQKLTSDKECSVISEGDRLTREQIELIERIMREQGEKLKFEQSAQKQLKTQQQRRQSTGSDEVKSLTIRSAETPNGAANSPTVKLTLTSVLVQNNNIKLLLQKGNATTSQVSGD